MTNTERALHTMQAMADLGYVDDGHVVATPFAGDAVVSLDWSACDGLDEAAVRALVKRKAASAADALVAAWKREMARRANTGAFPETKMEA